MLVAMNIPVLTSRLRTRSEMMLNGCIEWRRRIGKRGYGIVKVWDDGRVRTFYVHRLAWELECGPIPLGLTIDHRCFNKVCINVAHMDLVTRRENIARYWEAVTGSRSFCKGGHDKTDPDIWNARRRACRICESDRKLARTGRVRTRPYRRYLSPTNL